MGLRLATTGDSMIQLTLGLMVTQQVNSWTRATWRFNGDVFWAPEVYQDTEYI